MEAKEKRFLEKNRIREDEIMYMVKDGRKSIIYLSDGSKVPTSFSIKGILETLPEDMFESINKGIVISAKYVDYVCDNVYTMTDGRQFHGRTQVKKSQELNAKRYNTSVVECDWSTFNILKDFPIAFCIIELIFDENGHGTDFIFRYCNDEMEILEGKTLDEMLNKSFYEVFDNGDKKWLENYADVAINGTKVVFESYSPEVNSNLRIFCYQPKPNFCACALIMV